MKQMWFALEGITFTTALPFAAVAIAAGVCTAGLVTISHAFHLRGHRWGKAKEQGRCGR